MNEKEVRGFIDKSNFKNLINEMSQKFGQPKISKRLSMGLGDYNNLTLETKIRITNGKTDITQKVGDLNAVNREEITIFLDLEADEIYKLYKTYKNFTNSYQNPMRFIIQHENYIFQNEKFEIKLFRQFGNSEFFAFEVESLVEMEDSELIQFCNTMNLEIAENYNEKSLVEKRNLEVNINPDELSDSGLVSLIKSYL